MTVHCVYDGTLPAEDPFKEFTAIEHIIENYGDPLPEGETPPCSDLEGSEPPTETNNSFYMADTLRSLENETYDLGELPKELKQQKTEKVKYNVLMRCVSLHTWWYCSVVSSKDIVDNVKQWAASRDNPNRKWDDPNRRRDNPNRRR